MQMPRPTVLGGGGTNIHEQIFQTPSYVFFICEVWFFGTRVTIGPVHRHR